jgi:hypothetical protein
MHVSRSLQDDNAQPVYPAANQERIEKIFGRDEDELSDISEFSPGRPTSTVSRSAPLAAPPPTAVRVDKKHRRIVTQESLVPLPSVTDLGNDTQATTDDTALYRSSSTLFNGERDNVCRPSSRTSGVAPSAEETPKLGVSVGDKTSKKRRLDALDESAPAYDAPATPDPPKKRTRANLSSPTNGGAPVKKRAPSSRAKTYAHKKKRSPTPMTAIQTQEESVYAPSGDFTFSSSSPIATSPAPSRTSRRVAADKEHARAKRDKKSAVKHSEDLRDTVATAESPLSRTEVSTEVSAPRRSKRIKDAPLDTDSISHMPQYLPERLVEPEQLLSVTTPSARSPSPAIDETLKANKVKAKAERAIQALANLQKPKSDTVAAERPTERPPLQLPFSTRKQDEYQSVNAVEDSALAVSSNMPLP